MNESPLLPNPPPTELGYINYSEKSILELFLLMCGETEVPKEFYFWSCLSLIAACLQNRVSYRHMTYKPIRPNLYIILVGESGDGKGHAIGVATKVGRELEIGAENIDLGRYKGRITGARLYDILATRPDETTPTCHPIWLQSEELSNSIRTGDLAREFIKTVTDLWESHGGEVLLEGTRGQGERVLVDPCINWLAGSTMTWLKEVLDFADIDSGFFGRTIVVHAKRSTQPIYAPDTSMFEVLLPYIKEKLARVWSYEGEMVISEEARIFEKEWYEVETMEPPKKSFLFPTWKRRLDIVHKFAMILQCAQAKEDEWWIIPKWVSENAVMWYEDLLVHYELIIDNVILGKSDKKMERVQAFLKKHKQVTKVRLQQNMSGYGIRKDELGQIMNTLMEQNSLRQYNVPGTTQMIYEWIET